MKGVKAIKGNTKVKIGVWENYTVSEWYPDTPMEERNSNFVKWDLYFLEKGKKPKKVLDKKEGKFRFQQFAAGSKFLIVAYTYEPELDNASALLIEVVTNKKPDILNIKLTDGTGSPISKPLSYGQKVNVHVNTSGMIGHKMTISLWKSENGLPAFVPEQEKTVTVGSKGVAYQQFVIPLNTLKMIDGLMGKSSAKDEFYVTAFAHGEIVNSADMKMKVGTAPTKKEQRHEETKDYLKGKPTKNATPIPPVKKKIVLQHPPQRSNSTVKSVGLHDVYITDDKGVAIKGTYKGQKIRIWIISHGLIGKEFKFKLLEDDGGSWVDDELKNKNYNITADKTYVDVTLNTIPKSLGDDYFEHDEQELFVDIEILETKNHLKSATIDVDVKVFKQDPVNDSNSVLKFFQSDKKEEKGTECFCKQKENQFYWSNVLTCDQRKKVLQVCKNLWPASKPNEKASELMAIIHLETGTKDPFKPYADNGKNYSGLIQFSDESAKRLSTTRTKLKKMTFIEQMDYVEEYFSKNIAKLNTMTDLYLMVLKPNAIGKGNDLTFKLFDESISVPDGNGSNTSDKQRMLNIQKEPWVTKYGYASNPPFMKGQEHIKRRKWVYTRQAYEQRWGYENGNTTVKDVVDVLINDHYNPGKPNVFIGKCEKIKEEKKVGKQNAPWVDVAWEELNTYKGKTEVDSPLKERVAEYFKLSGTPSLKHTDAWCATFVFWCFQHTIYKDTNVKGNVGAFDWAEEGNSKIKGNNTKDGWILGEKSEVFVGAIIVFSFSHVAIIVGENNDGKKYVYLGGNQGSDTTGGQKICLGSASKTSKDIFMIMKPKNYIPTDDEKKLPKYDVEIENSGTSSR